MKENYKNKLQEFCQQNRYPMPKYSCYSKGNSHKQEWYAKLKLRIGNPSEKEDESSINHSREECVDNYRLITYCTKKGKKSKVKAEQIAAKKIYCRIMEEINSDKINEHLNENTNEYANE